MRILFVSVVVPYSQITTAGGVAVYTYIKQLAKRHSVDLVSAFAEGDNEKFTEMLRICRNVYSARRSISLNQNVRQVLSWMSGFCRGPLKHRWTILLANDLIRKNNYDVVQVEFTEAGLHIKRAGNTKMVLDVHDVNLKPALRRCRREKNWLKRILLFIDVWLTRWFEYRTYRNFDLVLTRSEYDMNLVKKYYKGTRVDVLPHPLDGAKLKSIGEVEPLGNSILFTGAFQRDVNVESARFIYREIFPRVREKYPDARLVFAGGNPSKEMLEWAKRHKYVTITGYVENLFKYYLKSTIFVAPMFVGGGVITKVVEAMFCGCPVVTNKIGNEGIGAQDGKHILLAESKEQFAEKINLLFKNENLRKKMSHNARKFAHERYEVGNVIKILEQYYTDLIST